MCSYLSYLFWYSYYYCCWESFALAGKTGAERQNGCVSSFSRVVYAKDVYKRTVNCNELFYFYFPNILRKVWNDRIFFTHLQLIICSLALVKRFWNTCILCPRLTLSIFTMENTNNARSRCRYAWIIELSGLQFLLIMKLSVVQFGLKSSVWFHKLAARVWLKSQVWSHIKIVRHEV